MTDSFTILMVEDDPGDVTLTREIFQDINSSIVLEVVENGVEALEYIRRKGKYAHAGRPDVVMLDLNLPKMDGREVLAEIKKDNNLKTLPVVIFTTSNSKADVNRAYFLGCNCYITKPVGLKEFSGAVRAIARYWLSIVTLP